MNGCAEEKKEREREKERDVKDGRSEMM